MTDDQVRKFNQRLGKIDKALEAGEIESADPYPPEHRSVLRLPAEVANRIKASAARNRRSLNSEIIRAIEAYLDR